MLVPINLSKSAASSNGLSGEGMNNLKELKNLIRKSKRVDASDPFAKIPDATLGGRVYEYLEVKAGPYPWEVSTFPKFESDCTKLLVEPCEKLRKSFKNSLPLYKARVMDEKLVAALKANAATFDALETAAICENLITSTVSICEQSFAYFCGSKKLKCTRYGRAVGRALLFPMGGPPYRK